MDERYYERLLAEITEVKDQLVLMNGRQRHGELERAVLQTKVAFLEQGMADLTRVVRQLDPWKASASAAGGGGAIMVVYLILKLVGIELP